MIRRIVILFLCAFLSTAFSCGPGDATEYILTVDGYLNSFTGYYYIDGKLEEDFVGKLITGSTSHYYYEKNLPVFTSVKVYVTKDSATASVEATIWKDDKEIKSVSIGSNAKDSGGGDILNLVMYYEADTDSTTTSTSK